MFLRAVNVSGSGKLAMSDLRAICEAIGAQDVKTYIASGNVALSSGLSAADLGEVLEARLQDYAGKPVGVFVRTHTELAGLLAENPFGEAAGNRVAAILLNGSADVALDAGVKGQADEQIVAGEGALLCALPQRYGAVQAARFGGVGWHYA